MLFNSVPFLLFLAIVLPLYFLLPQKFRPILLLAASYYFYMSWNAAYLGLLILFTLLIYLLSAQIERANGRGVKKLFLILGLILPFGALFLFKYFDTTAAAAVGILGRFGLTLPPARLSLILPVGISFYTFQLTGYLIDVYRGDLKHEKNLLYFALYVSFFPQLVAGPIERAGNLLPQFRERHSFSSERTRRSILLILWGYFKKVVIADRLAIFVDTVYSSPSSFAGAASVIATVFFAIQIYCDFSGYCDIAIGVADIMGFRLMTNFNHPYSAQSIKEFWDRWHISLSSWLRDYLYIPLGGNRVCKARYLLNVLIIFAVSGIWHGAGLTFFLWGLIHGCLVAAHRLLVGKKQVRHCLPVRVLCRALTFAAVCAAWVFFRAGSLADALLLFRNMTQFPSGFFTDPQLLECGLSLPDLIAAAAGIVLLFVCEHFSEPLLSSAPRWFAPLRWIVWLILVFVCLIFGVYGANTVTQFIYFQF